jgi:hypothetical protein
MNFHNNAKMQDFEVETVIQILKRLTGFTHLKENAFL